MLDNLAALAGEELDGIEDTLDALRQVANALDASGQPIVLDLGMPTDFEYYTGVVFEFDADGQTWGRGGRYALPAPVEQRSACGLALDADALSRHVERPETSGVLVAVLPASAADAARSIDVARSLHRHGIPAALESAADGAPVTVRVSGDSLQATANGEQRTIKDFQELLSLALEQK
ncbi:MAG: ATP phosphoribosyltransferase regulatory subunit [Dehalococcoidia bacterium]|nr:ATP phosphoribosyltransferase regulatory subunit [Dehalococcoidia bacterium]